MKRIIAFCFAFSAFVLFLSCPCHSAPENEFDLSEEDTELIVRLVHFETKGKSLLCKTAFSAIILNRLCDERFPSNVHDVIFDAGAFESTSRKDFWKSFSEEETIDDEIAVKYAVSKRLDPTCGALFAMKKDDLLLWQLERTFEIDGLVFGTPW